MGFDLETARPLSAGGGFDLSSARPVDPRSVPDSQPAVAQPVDRRQSRAGGLTGFGEAGMSMLTGLTGGLIGRAGGTLGGIAGSIASGLYGTQEGAAMAAQTAEEGAHRFTYQPRTQEGQQTLEAISRLFDKSKLAGMGPSESLALGQAMPAASEAALGARQAPRQVARAVADVLDIPEAPVARPMGSVGAASTGAAEMRRQAAESLPVPIKLTKGQAERTFEQQQFEREMAKNPSVGGPIRQRIEEQNRAILQNFDSWIDQTGAEAGSIRSTGEAVTTALANKAEKAKNEIRFAYEVARRKGDMAERVPVGSIEKYVEDHAPEAINAPIITSVGAKLEKVAKDGTVSINDLEEVRKMVGTLAGKDATNAHFGREIKSLIDSLTEGAGGESYKKARALRFKYGQEFEDHAVVDRLLSFKPGTRDRSVAYEDVFAHSILKGSLDDVHTLRNTLQTAGEQGKQAWRELQGATIKHIRDEITSGVSTDSMGQRVLSPAKLNKIVTELDKDGKLDFVFGKQGAQQIRDINGLAIDAFTAPPGAVNHSNTASILLAALDKVASKTTGVPFVGSAVNYAAGEVRNASLRRQVKDALK